MLIVKKFGGSSVADKDRIFNVARQISESYREGNNVVVVLSAMGKTTNHLIAQANDINPRASRRELDMLLTCGEQISVALMAMALSSLGIPAVSLNAWQVAMHTNSAYGNARLKNIDTERIAAELESGKVVVVTGFQGINKYDDYTTLGRGGSDTTAVALAAVLGADACEIYTDVEGVYTADPRVVPNARKLKEITYDEMLEMASLGAKVLHNRSVELAKKYGVQLIVRSSLTPAEGTVVKEVVKVEKMLVSGVAVDENVSRIAVMGLADVPGTAFRLFNLISQKKINVDLIVQSVGYEGTKDIAFTVSSDNVNDVVSLLEQNKEILQYSSLEISSDVAKISLVGSGIMSTPGMASKMFEALYDAGINTRMISTSEIKISVLVDKRYAHKAMIAVHDKFQLGE
ncbi:aspartate kinase [Catenibacillus scindens]|uniref:Aspartokinase n=1 Tax=Catenibacillus scindens TaxID=673271 RepID=A0A7W8M5V0_9FIRM|nr:aspartate kinase [Catenibacillus scindens]MBB5265613.1 aspartate kinase [Catenibacillus scindens]